MGLFIARMSFLGYVGLGVVSCKIVVLAKVDEKGRLLLPYGSYYCITAVMLRKRLLQTGLNREGC